jgi:hypothetical protein
MSEVIDPPEYYFPNIDFNPAFYALDTDGLTQSTANTLYLRKTVPDTATALETFTSGIKTPSIASTRTAASATLDIGIAPRTVAGAVHHYSDGDNCVSGAGVHINNGINNNSHTNIHNGTGANATGEVNIMSGTSNSGTIKIGATGTTTTINGIAITTGNSNSLMTMNATNIKQVMKTVAGTSIENIVGNTTVVPSLSTTFNTKVASGTLTPLNCYTIAANTGNQFTAQYFEIVVSGSNNSRGAYTYKGCFGIEKIGTGSMTASSVTTLFYYGTGTNPPSSTVAPVIDFTLAGNTLTLRVNAKGGAGVSTTQNFVTTLISYPTASIVSSQVLEDFIITAV